MKRVLSCTESWTLFNVLYFVVMLLPLCVINVTATGVKDEITIIEDGSTMNISFIKYDVKLETSQVIDNLITLPPITRITINIISIPPSVKYVLLQTHSFLYNVTLSYSIALAQHMYMNGTDVGLVKILGAGQTQAQFVVYNSNDNINATVLVAAQGYGDDAPVPGGCNMEFDVEIAPTLRVSYTDALVLVENQPAATPLATPPPRSCEMSRVEMELYHMFLPERDFSMKSHFEAIRMMMTVDDVRKNGRKVETSLQGSPMQRYYSLYPGAGTVYAIVAGTGSASAAYVPAVTYGCNVIYSTDCYEALNTVFSKLLCAVVLFLGFFICLLGHRFFKSEMFLFGFLASGFVAYILLSREGSTDFTAAGGLAVIIGLAFGSVWVLFWCCFGLPVMSVSLVTLSLGFLVAAVIMHAGLADVQIFELDLNFWVVFLSITLSLAIASTTEVKIANIVSCAVLGGFAVIIPIDHYIGGNVKYILVNVLRRATLPHFNKAVIDPPFQARDIILVSLWIALVVMGVTLQLYQHQGKPPFPAPPCRGPVGPRPRLRTNDRTSLLAHAHTPYGSVSTVPGSAFESPAISQRRFTLLPKFPVAPLRPRNRDLF